MAIRDYFAKLQSMQEDLQSRRNKPAKERAQERIVVLRAETEASNLAEEHVSQVMDKLGKVMLAPGGDDVKKAYLETVRDELAHRLRVAKSKGRP